MKTFYTFAAGMAAMALWAAAASGSAHTAGTSEDPLQRFQEAVGAYMLLREAAAHTVPPLEISPDGEEISAAIDAMAEAMRAARPSAREGDIFDAATTVLLRARIRERLDEADCDEEDILASERNDGRLPAPPRPLVHERFDWAAGSYMPFCMFTVLPGLPETLQYRFVERDLVLVDVDADLVIDVLPDALPPMNSWGILQADVKYFAAPASAARTTIGLAEETTGHGRC